MSETARKELTWWITKLQIVSGKAFTDPAPLLTIYADASGTGWGATCGGVEAGGTWMWRELDSHINVRELLAAFKALRTFAESYLNCNVALRLDNTSAVLYINSVAHKSAWESSFSHAVDTTFSPHVLPLDPGDNATDIDVKALIKRNAVAFANQGLTTYQIRELMKPDTQPTWISAVQMSWTAPVLILMEEPPPPCCSRQGCRFRGSCRRVFGHPSPPSPGFTGGR